jgi:hypothetical protein
MRRDAGCGWNAAAAHVYRIRAPRGLYSSRSKYNRMGVPICWQCEVLAILVETVNIPQKNTDRIWRNKYKKWRR